MYRIDSVLFTGLLKNILKCIYFQHIFMLDVDFSIQFCLYMQINDFRVALKFSLNFLIHIEMLSIQRMIGI